MDARHYTLGMLNVHMAWVSEFVSSEVVTQAVMTQGAVSSTTSKPGLKAFKSMIAKLTGG